MNPNPFLYLIIKLILITPLIVIVMASCGTETNYSFEEVENPDEAILKGQVNGYIKRHHPADLDCQSSNQGTRVADFTENLTLSIGDSIDVSKMFVRNTSNKDIMFVWFGLKMCEKWERHRDTTA